MIFTPLLPCCCQITPQSAGSYCSGMSGMRFYSSFTEVSLHLPSSDSRYITHFHRSTFLFQRISLHWTQNAYWVCLSLSVCLCVSMLSVVCHAYRNNLIRLRWLACSVRRRHPPPAADEQTFIINKEDYLIKPCSLQLLISLLVVTVPVVVIWIRWGQVVTCSGPTGPIHAGMLNVTTLDWRVPIILKFHSVRFFWI